MDSEIAKIGTRAAPAVDVARTVATPGFQPARVLVIVVETIVKPGTPDTVTRPLGDIDTSALLSADADHAHRPSKLVICTV